MKAIILSAGQGARLLPFTATTPKCLVEVGGRSMLEWQLRSLAAAGVESATVVVGFGADQVESRLASICPPGLRARTLFNPQYATADNLVSCLAARDEMGADFLLLNGDTLFEPEVVARLLRSNGPPVAVAVSTKEAYDADDMKVSCDGARVLRVGKDLSPAETSGEAIGMSIYRGDGPRLFVAALEEVAAEPEGHRRWYLSAVTRLAGRGLVGAVSVTGIGWTEIDFPEDLERAEALVSAWDGQGGRESESHGGTARA